MSKLDDFKATAASATAELLSKINLAGDILAGEVSPDGTQVTTAGPTLLDASAHAWSMSVEPDPGYPHDFKILRDGTWYFGGSAILLTIKTGVIYVKDFSELWWKDNGAGWAASSDPS